MPNPKNATTLPMGRKVEGFSSAQLVTYHRAASLALAKAKLLGQPHERTESWLSKLTAELKRRNITILNPELNEP